MKNYRCIAVLLSSFFFAACDMDATTPTNAGPRKFADFSAYFGKEVQTISTNGNILHKTATLNGKTDTVTVAADSTRMHDLLKPFMDINLNKPSLSSQYDTSSLIDHFSGRRSVIYQSKGKETNPYEVILEMDAQGHIQEVKVNGYVSNMVYDYRQNLVYRRHQAIMISTYQKIAFLPAKELEVNVTLEPKKGGAL